ncbi:MAG: peptidoglycan DD-metalloendopeptidase family protein [Anaerolineae bacterium]|nr:peptidoglycan DD-metalloendopeptidase family protein [Anaerolineae bacterium]
MNDKQQPRTIRRVIIWLLVLSALGVAVWQWGDEALYYATGQHIIDSVEKEIGAEQSAGAAIASDQSQPADSGQLAAPSTDPDNLTGEDFPYPARQHVLKYRVRSGDALFALAERFDLHASTILWANDDQLHGDPNALQIGMELYILPTNGIYHFSDGQQTIGEIAALYGVQPNDILASPYNTLIEESSSVIPPYGLRIVVPGGRSDSIFIPEELQPENGEASLDDVPLQPGACDYEPYDGEPESFVDPLTTAMHTVTAEFTSWHPGLDIAASEGALVLAPTDGIISFSGEDDELGNVIIIDHGAGWTTHHAHLKNLLVECGETVEGGQRIGTVGMSGNATSAYLYFELRQNDVPVDPRPGACRHHYNITPLIEDMISPLQPNQPYRVTTDFIPNWHVGIDLAALIGTPIYAAHSGVVVYAGDQLLGLGETVIIDHGNGMTTTYAHLDNLFVDCGAQVQQGQHIGEMGNSGNSSGVHLHFEIREDNVPVDPRDYLEFSEVVEDELQTLPPTPLYMDDLE